MDNCLLSGTERFVSMSLQEEIKQRISVVRKMELSMKNEFGN